MEELREKVAEMEISNVEAEECIETLGSGKVIKGLGIVGLIAAAGGVIYYGFKKIKSKKEANEEFVDVDYEEIEDNESNDSKETK